MASTINLEASEMQSLPARFQQMSMGPAPAAAPPRGAWGAPAAPVKQPTNVAPPPPAVVAPTPTPTPPVKPPVASTASTLSATSEADITPPLIQDEGSASASGLHVSPTNKIFDEKLVKKPKDRGSLGRPIKLHTNHYRVNVKPFTVYQYDLTMKKKNPTERDRGKEEVTIKRILK
jgi:hypothetical protein